MVKRGRDYIGVGVGIVLFDDRGRVFLAQRGPEAQNEVGTWEFPGGGVEFGDTLEYTIIREMQEEFDIIIDVLELLDVADHLIPLEGQHWVSPSYIGRITCGQPVIKEPHKCSDIGWFELHELSNMPLSLVTAHNLESLRKKYPDRF